MHDASGAEGAFVSLRMGFVGELKFFEGKVGMAGQKVVKSSIWFLGKEAFGGDSEGAKGFTGQVNASKRGILSHIAKDVGVLEGIAEMLCIGGTVGMATAEDSNADKSDGASDSPAIGA